ncbi:MAG: hypothetical protein V7727_22310, partial [Sneathiella sp.]
QSPLWAVRDIGVRAIWPNFCTMHISTKRVVCGLSLHTRTIKAATIGADIHTIGADIHASLKRDL